MRPTNRLRWRLTLLYSLVTLISGAVLLILVASLARTLPPDRTIALPGIPVAPPVPPPDRDAVRADPLIDPLTDPLTDPDSFPDQVLIVPGAALLLMVPLSLGFGWLIAGRMLRPIRTMTGSLQRISGRNVHERLALTGHRDEFKDLADTIDGLLGRLEVALDGHKRFVANAAHELRTPLTVEHALLEESLIDPGATVESYRANFEQLLAVNRHRGELLESLLTLAGSESARDEGEPVHLDDVVTAALAERSAELERHDLRVEAVIRPTTTLGDRMLLARLVANLLDNAIHYNEPGGTVEVSVRAIDGHARLIVANTGAPVPPEQVDRLFEPFQRLHRVADDGHHGLGLSIVRAIALAHAAHLTAQAHPGGGLRVEALFPLDVDGPTAADVRRR
ncbi:ATP-binding protein [Dactylosporangium fulvum]|uniref:histidine kinase n=1 Tax=Dactylosporangium fulvum TaxID=53359 RepID=A0ABY5W7K5_9ACTN|nr:HAMP domain-containing sensor histidine kinase [Dactylosporangium fulvum]UWP85350.1 HAMP domain-containing histidine kinase [Dactylosporangium fulvum]